MAANSVLAAGRRPSRTRANIAMKLYQRSIEGSISRRSGVLNGRLYDVRLPRLGVDLESILDREKEIVHHIILGFTRNGHHLLSYSTNDLLNDLDRRRMSGCVSLHWWRFDPYKPLKNVASCSIFTGEFNGCDEPLLAVCEDADSTWVVTFGVFSSGSLSDSVQECFVTIAPNPVKSYPQLQAAAHPFFCVCLKYELCPPFPKVKPELSMGINDTVIVNTGVFVMALRIGRGCTDVSDMSCVSKLENWDQTGHCDSTSHPDTDSMPLQSDFISDKTTESAPSDLIRLVFVCEDAITRLSELIGSAVPKPDCVLMFDVVGWQGQEMRPVNADVWDAKCSRDDEVVVPVTQVIFNVDRYLSHALLLNKDIAGRVKAVMDYDMEVVDVCRETKQVIILLKSLVKAFHSADSDRSSPKLYTMGFVLAWNAWTGETKTLDIHSLHETTASRDCSQGLGTLHEAWRMRKYEMVPMTSCRAVKVLSNRTVFTGQSLKYVLHPTLPLYVFHKQHSWCDN